MKLAALGLAAALLVFGGPAGAQSVDEATASGVRTEKQRVRADNRNLIIRRKSSRDMRRILELQQFREQAGGRPRSSSAPPPRSEAANPPRGTVRTQ